MNRNNHPVEIDHIDPRWKEGRDYQLVCGLDCLANYREEDWKRNTAKSNRFLPWRWSRDEIGVVPEEYGDLAQFLVNGEWVLLEFLSEEWFAVSKNTYGAAQVKRDNTNVIKQWETFRANPELLNARNQKIANTSRERNSIKSAHEAQLEWRENNPAEYSSSKRQASLVGKRYRYKCTITGHTSTASGLTIYQQHRGIDPSNRIRLQ